MSTKDADDSQQDSQLLLDAFQSFNEASLQLEQAYTELQAHTQKLDLELKATNEKLKESLREEERMSLHLRGILETLKTGILVIDLEGTVLEINPSAQQVLGVEGKVAHYSEMNLDGQVEEFIRDCLEKSYSRIPKKEVMLTREGEQLTLELSFSLVRPEGGGILSVLIIINDMTLINRLKNQSNRTARLAAMGEMAAELAHEIRNPLGSIKLFSGLLEQDLAGMPDQRNLAGQISHAVQVMENIVSNILAYSADVRPRQERLVLHQVITQSFSLFELELQRKQIQLAYEPPSETLMLMGDAHLLKQMMMNLCINAVKAMESNGVLAISIRSKDDYLELVIKDTGRGIPENQLHKIFDPFYTTFQGGTGLGLSVVNQIIEKHHGAIDIKSVVGEGTSVFVTLPRVYG